MAEFVKLVLDFTIIAALCILAGLLYGVFH